MAYLVSEILVCLVIAALLGGAIGWLLRARGTRREVAAALGEVGALRADLDRANGSLGSAQRDLEGVRDELAAAAHALEERDEEVSTRSDLISELEATINQQKSGFKEEVAGTEALLEAAQTELENLATRYSELKAEHEKEKKKLDQQLAEARQAQKEAPAASQQRLDAKSARLASLEERAAELEARVATQRAEAGQREAQLRVQLETAEEQAGPEAPNDGGTIQETAVEGIEVRGAAEEAFAAATRGERPAEIDDLKKIHGIGPKLEAMLHTLGVFTFRQVAHWTSQDVAWVESKLEEFPGRIERDDWRGGARKEHGAKFGEEA